MLHTGSTGNTALALIYDYDKCNDYAKVIMDKSTLFFKAYLYPQVYDFFVKGVSAHFGIDRGKFKICYDISSLTLSIILSLVLFAGFKGVGIGTLVMATFNGLMINFFDKTLDKYVEFTPAFKKLAKVYDLEEN